MLKFIWAHRRLAGALAAPTLYLVAAQAAQAAPDEIEVYQDELQAPGHLGLELHLNHVLSGETVPDYPRAEASQGAFRLTPEFAYGLAPHLEFGALALSSVARDGSTAIGGAKVRLRALDAPEGRGWYWGANLEVGRSAKRFEQSPWNGELRGIYGGRSGRWALAVNPILSWSFGADQPATLEIAAKATYRLNPGLAVGLESYNDLGPVRRPGRLGEEEQMLYAVADTDVLGLDLNLGLGRGLTGASDGWVAKAVIGIKLR